MEAVAAAAALRCVTDRVHVMLWPKPARELVLDMVLGYLDHFGPIARQNVRSEPAPPVVSTARAGHRPQIVPRWVPNVWPQHKGIQNKLS